MNEIFYVPNRFLKQKMNGLSIQDQISNNELSSIISSQLDPVITQATKENLKVMDSNKKYNKLFSVFQRFSSRSTQEDQSTFNKILEIFTTITESIEQNKVDDIYEIICGVQNLPDLSFSLSNKATEPHTEISTVPNKEKANKEIATELN